MPETTAIIAKMECSKMKRMNKATTQKDDDFWKATHCIRRHWSDVIFSRYSTYWNDITHGIVQYCKGSIEL